MSTQRSLGWLSATALVVANMIGAGVFTTSGLLLQDLGSPWAALLVWLGGGALATLGALSYSALARRLPESGGEYLFLSRTLHPAAGYIAGWVSLLVGFSAPLAAVAYGFGAYAGAWLPALSPQLSGTLLLLVFSGLHAAHVRGGAWFQNWMVVAKVALLLAFIAFAVPHLPPPPQPSLGGASLAALGAALVLVSFSYSGWNAAVYLGGEIAEPERNLPRSLLLGTGLVTALYLALNAVLVFAAPVAQLSGKLEVVRLAAQALGGSRLADAATAAILLAMLTSVSAMTMAGPRVYARMATDGYLPRGLAGSDGPPRGSILLQCVLALFMLWSSTYDSLLTYIGFTLGLSTAATVVGLVRLRLREGAVLPVPGWPWIPALFLAGVLAITLSTIVARPWESLCGLATLALGGLAWRLTARRSDTPPPPTNHP
jgi:APA family basic amino acid/polyamine antiporter